MKTKLLFYVISVFVILLLVGGVVCEKLCKRTKGSSQTRTP